MERNDEDDNDEKSVSSDRAQTPRLSTESDVPDEFQVDAAAATVQCGDCVLLGYGVLQEHRACPAIVTKVADTHCTVAVLDGEMQYGIGECWPCFHDISLTTCMLRLGMQVVVKGMSGDNTKHLNGLTGTIFEHPREGHPVFVRKAKCPECPRLAVAIKFHDPRAAKQRSALLEPQFLRPYDEAELQTELSAIQCLEDVLARLQ